MSNKKPTETLSDVMARIAADRGMTITALAKVLGNSYATFWNKVTKERFTIGQIKYLQEKIFLTPSEIYDIINVSTPKDASAPGHKISAEATNKSRATKADKSE